MDPKEGFLEIRLGGDASISEAVISFVNTN